MICHYGMCQLLIKKNQQVIMQQICYIWESSKRTKSFPWQEGVYETYKLMSWYLTSNCVQTTKPYLHNHESMQISTIPEKWPKLLSEKCWTQLWQTVMAKFPLKDICKHLMQKCKTCQYLMPLPTVKHL